MPWFLDGLGWAENQNASPAMLAEDSEIQIAAVDLQLATARKLVFQLKKFCYGCFTRNAY